MLWAYHPNLQGFVLLSSLNPDNKLFCINVNIQKSSDRTNRDLVRHIKRVHPNDTELNAFLDILSNEKENEMPSSSSGVPCRLQGDKPLANTHFECQFLIIILIT